MAVKERDGDGCRYCGIVVYWRGDRRSKKAGTYDHRIPGQAATVDTSVVACAECNGTRGGYQRHGMTLEQIDEHVPLLPAPTEPYYSEFTADQLTKHFGRPFVATKARPGTQPDTARPATPPQPVAPQQLATGHPVARADSQSSTAAAPARRDPAPSRGPQPAAARPGSQPDTARSDDLGDDLAAPSPRVPAPVASNAAGQGPPGSADVSRAEVYGPGRVGSGRVGSPPAAQVVPARPPGRPPRRRGSRGGRSRPVNDNREETSP
jgi:hypothetical protein